MAEPHGFLVGTLRQMAASKSLVVAGIAAAVSTCVLLAFRAVNPGQGAEHYYMRENKVLYRVMQLCYVVIIASIAFNARYALTQTVKMLMSRAERSGADRKRVGAATAASHVSGKGSSARTATP
jgi:hypothetical protein